jgi:uncharacterized membrane protein YidH (DUF202 family)
MMTFEMTTMRYRLLQEWQVLSAQELRDARDTAAARGVDVETVLTREYGVPKNLLLQALSERYHLPFAEYDEKMPVAPELLAGLDNEQLSISRWFPLIRDGNTVVIAANDPTSPAVHAEAKAAIEAERYDFWVALNEDIQWYIQDYFHAEPGRLIGTERTGLAFWRNTMALWRTRLACYRSDLAKARTHLALLRWGLAFVALADTLLRLRGTSPAVLFYWCLLFAGGIIGAFGLKGYLAVRRSRMKPPGHHTLVEVTSATLQFLENYHFIPGTAAAVSTKQTMLARLGDFLGDHCTILIPQPASRERTHLARERNVLAAQRTVAACYRTLYARGRTGLAFIRTGVSFASLGAGFLHFFSFGMLTPVDGVLILAGTLMAVDGLRWYLPVRSELAEVPRCPVPQ